MGCEYPDCESCRYNDCVMEKKDIAAMLKRRRWHNNPEMARRKQQEYRDGKRKLLPHCDVCPECVLVRNEKSDGCKRLCVNQMRLVDRKVNTSPFWCIKRNKGECNESIGGV